MRRWSVVVLILILILSGVAVYILTTIKPKPAKIGIFYYVWYGAPDSDNWNASKFVDFPVLGNYSSSDPAVIKQQLLLMEKLGIDFVVISWWGFYDNYGNFTNAAAKQALKVAEDNLINLKFAIMVEPFNRSGSSYDYAGIYDHIYQDFVTQFSSVYYNESKPLICFFNDQNLTDNGTFPTDERFHRVLVGQEPYVQWMYTDLNSSHIPFTNQISVTPRYDDSRFRNPNCTVDPDLSQGIYDQEWKNAVQLWKDGKIHIILITSWNEYPERTAIEPHYDATAHNPDPYFLYNKTKDYISQAQLRTK